MSRWWVAVALCLSLLACSEPADQAGEGRADDVAEGPVGDAADEAADEPLTAEEYVAQAHEACEHYLGALFSLVETDEHIDLASEDASAELFRRRAGDIGALYADYRSRLDALSPPEEAEAAHEQLLAVQDEHVHTLQALGEAHHAGDEERAGTLLAESTRLEGHAADLQAAVGVRPCGQ